MEGIKIYNYNKEPQKAKGRLFSATGKAKGFGLTDWACRLEPDSP